MKRNSIRKIVFRKTKIVQWVKKISKNLCNRTEKWKRKYFCFKTTFKQEEAKCHLWEQILPTVQITSHNQIFQPITHLENRFTYKSSLRLLIIMNHRNLNANLKTIRSYWLQADQPSNTRITKYSKKTPSTSSKN